MSPRTSAPRGGYAVGDARRRRILDVAVRHLAERGYHGSSLARIAAEAGLSQAGLLHHFGSKQELVVAVLEHRDEESTGHAFTGGESGLDVLRALVRLAEINLTRPDLLRMFTRLSVEAADPGHPAHGYFVRRYAAVTERTAAALAAGVDRGEIRAGLDLTGIAQEIMAVMDGLQAQWCLRPEAVDMVARFRDQLDRIARSISVDGRGLAGTPAPPAGTEPRPAARRDAPLPRRRDDGRARDRRSEILLAALEVFGELGYRGATLAAVAERAGLTQQGLLHHFPGKESLLVAMLGLREHLDTLRMLAEGAAAPRLEHIEQLAEYNATRPGVVQTFTVLAAESVTDGHPARDYFVERYARLRTLGADALRAELGGDLPGGVAPEEAAALLLAVQDGAQLQWLLDPDAVDLPALVRAFTRLLRE
ncbi:TetR/AcrR family transcriptional regulator [Actinomadura kijaniata]|uniref:TetR/AcrR family transcriptional regulator n=1 Tax=Actinomadura kijaniata TaxID=46161 RepID=UPI000A9560D6|nr:TetR/AcrR family transcriptional regulator [Actinomadura kijaniata]